MLWRRLDIVVLGVTAFLDSVWSARCRDRCKIAVCISGQVSRWMPKYLMENVIQVNQNHDLYLFWNLQVNNEQVPIHSSGIAFQPTEAAIWDWRTTQEVLHNFSSAYPNMSIASLMYHRPENLEYWMNVTGGHLDRFKQFNMHHGSSISVNIMNMYHAHVKCAEQIVAYEEQQHLVERSAEPWRFDYILSTREDSYFFTPLNISVLIAHVRTDPTSSTDGGPKCDMVYKNCLDFGGFNMRLFLYNRAAGLTTLGQRFEFYRTMRAGGWKVPNPETFESLQADNFGLTGCALPVDMIPVTAARHVANGTVCFYDFELGTCMPDSVAERMKSALRCEDVQSN